MGRRSRVVELCRRQNRNCIYAHGPAYDQACKTLADYLQALTKRVRRAGLMVARGAPVSVPRGPLGNTMFHVRQNLKADYTQKYH